MKMLDKIKNEIVKAFLFDGDFIYAEPFGCGHINATYAVYFRRETKPPVRYICRQSTPLFYRPSGPDGEYPGHHLPPPEKNTGAGR